MDDLSRTLGSHDAQIGSLDARLNRMESKMDEMLEVVNQHRGGFRVLAGVATLGGAVGAAIVKAFAVVKGA